MFEIDKKSMVPVYYQLRERLLEQIKTGNLKVGDPIPTELELCKKYGLSRTPVRQAIGDLVKEGLLYRERGRGTFVKKVSKEESRLIGVLLPCIKKVGITPDILRGIEDVTHEREYNIILCNTDHNFEKEEIYATQLVSKKVAGVIFYPLHSNNENKYYKYNLQCVNRFIRNGVKVVLVDRMLKKSDEENKLDYVVTDNFQGAYDLTSHLIKIGHRRIGLLTTPYCDTVEERLNGYKKALEENGISFDKDLIRTGESEVDYHLYHDLTKEFLSMDSKPTAIFAINDLMAREVLMALRKEGIKVPEDMAVVGYDDVYFGVSLEPPLTTVRQPTYEEGKIATNILIDRCEGKIMEKQQIVLKSKLIVRESCGAKLNEQSSQKVSSLELRPQSALV